jgi:hypothetical protein
MIAFGLLRGVARDVKSDELVRNEDNNGLKVPIQTPCFSR